MWQVEHIPDQSRVFKRAHRNWFRRGKDTFNFDELPAIGIFANLPAGSSCDWERYATPEETRNREGKGQDNAVVSLLAGEVRMLPSFRVEHSPDATRHNRAHSDIFAAVDQRELDIEIRTELRRLCRLEIKLSAAPPL